MTVIGFHASHEQVHPSALLDAVQHAEQAGFTAAMCSDHFAPWSERQGHSGFAWAWLGAALQATRLPFGVVTAPGQRYHPAITAQAASTLSAMYPGRFWAALGSGENMNEHITGDEWPDKETRNRRLRQSVDVMRGLLAGEEVSMRGEVTVHEARLWTRPDVPPPLLAAAVTPETAGWAAEWADGLITVAQPHDALRGVIDAYRAADGSGPIALQVHLSYADSYDEALAIAHDQWRTGSIGPPRSWDIAKTEVFDRETANLPAEELPGFVQVSDDLSRHADWLSEAIDLGFDEVYLHHVGKEQQAFIEQFGAHVLPQLGPTFRSAA
jgi:probable non-F420 flavinoid oxidoreductase